MPRHFFRIGRVVFIVNKFSHNATSRGSVLPLQELKGCKTLFFCAYFGLVPLPHNCAAALHATTLLLGVPRKRITFVGWALDALCCRKKVYTQRYFTGSVIPLQELISSTKKIFSTHSRKLPEKPYVIHTKKCNSFFAVLRIILTKLLTNLKNKKQSCYTFLKSDTIIFVK